MKYDAELARAEVEKYIILVQHHIRQAKVNKDSPTAKHLNNRVAKLSEEARSAYLVVARKQWFLSLPRVKGKIRCDGCASYISETAPARELVEWIIPHVNCKRKVERL